MSHISDADVLSHFALVASSPRYVKRRRLRMPIPTSENTTWSTTERRPRKNSLHHIHASAKSLSQSNKQALSWEDEILNQLDEQARRRTAAAQLSQRGHPASPLLGENTPRANIQPQLTNVLPPPPSEISLLTSGRGVYPSSPVEPGIESEADDAHRPSWSFATPAPPIALSRQHHPSSSLNGQDDHEDETAASEADMSEVDELATPAVGKEHLLPDADEEEEQQLDGDKTPTKAHSDEVPTLLSLPQRLWSTLRPGLSLYVVSYRVCVTRRRLIKYRYIVQRKAKSRGLEWNGHVMLYSEQPSGYVVWSRVEYCYLA